jgi:hypothetical protein
MGICWRSTTWLRGAKSAKTCSKLRPHKAKKWNKKERDGKKMGDVAKTLRLLIRLKAVCGPGTSQALSAGPSNYALRVQARCEGKAKRWEVDSLKYVARERKRAITALWLNFRHVTKTDIRNRKRVVKWEIRGRGNERQESNLGESKGNLRAAKCLLSLVGKYFRT